MHGVARNAGDGRVYLATHDGLFRHESSGYRRVGPVLDLMGFTVAGADHFYASGHPGPGVDLPNPVGLIESRDGGRSWKALSRQGESDFHALTASGTGVVGYDGQLVATRDGRSWRPLSAPVAPYSLAASPDGAVVVATSQSGLVRSEDAGRTWRAVAGAPLLMLVDWVDATTVTGVTPDGTAAISDDGGRTWVARGNAGGPPQALGAARGADKAIELLVVTDGALVHSADSGGTFSRGAPPAGH